MSGCHHMWLGVSKIKKKQQQQTLVWNYTKNVPHIIAFSIRLANKTFNFNSFKSFFMNTRVSHRLTGLPSVLRITSGLPSHQSAKSKALLILARNHLTAVIITASLSGNQLRTKVPNILQGENFRMNVFGKLFSLSLAKRKLLPYQICFIWHGAYFPFSTLSPLRMLQRSLRRKPKLKIINIEIKIHRNCWKEKKWRWDS